MDVRQTVEVVPGVITRWRYAGHVSDVYQHVIP